MTLIGCVHEIILRNLQTRNVKFDEQFYPGVKVKELDSENNIIFELRERG